MNIVKSKKLIIIASIVFICAIIIVLLSINFNKKDLTYNKVISSKLKPDKIVTIFKSGYEGQVITWRGKISNYYSQITGIKFCVVDKEHQKIDINKPCDWFWAMSDNLMNADIISANPDWDGKWVNYILKYYKVPFDKNTNFYDEVYNITGEINGIDCGVDDKCIPDIEIINITK